MSATRIDAEIGDWFSRIRLSPSWRKRIASAAVRAESGVGIEVLREQRRRIARAFADGGFTDDEYRQRLREVDDKIEATQPDRLPQLEVVADLVADTRKLWDKATPGERRQLLAPLLDRVTVCLDAKRVVDIIPTPAFRQLLPVAGAGARESHL